jgi:hypothetical protein
MAARRRGRRQAGWGYPCGDEQLTAGLRANAVAGRQGGCQVAHWKKIWSTNPQERVNKEIPVLYWVRRAFAAAAD